MCLRDGVIASALGGVVLSCVGSTQINMMIVAGVLLLIGAAFVSVIKETIGEPQNS
mgnify:CR=1 FL=1